MAASDQGKDLSLSSPDATKAGDSLAPARIDEPVREEADPAEAMKQLALGRGIQSLWAALLPMIGVRASRAGEFPGVFQVEAGPRPHEALVHIDVPDAPYVAGEKPKMGRVVSLSVTLAHDFRRLGDKYYCVDCEIPADETRH
jgi:hypothetical protein